MTEDEAKKYSEQGQLVVIAYKNPSAGHSGHLVTFSVGENRSKGELANIGIKSGTGFVPATGAKNAAFRQSDWETVNFYIINPDYKDTKKTKTIPYKYQWSSDNSNMLSGKASLGNEVK